MDRFDAFLSWVPVCLLASVFCVAAPATADEWSELGAGDAGELVGDAQVTMGEGRLDSIRGTIANFNDADLYQIYIDEPSQFSATTSGGDVGGTGQFDSVLALFDADGFGVYYNDDRVNGDGNSALPSGNANGPQAPGFYYLGIADEFNGGPLSGPALGPDDLIFFFIGEPQAPFTEVFGPNGPGGAAPLTAWGDFDTKPFTNAGYEIILTGARFAVDTTPAGPLVSAVLPASRSVQVGNQASAFATVINSGAITGTNCGIAPESFVAADFRYQTTDADNQLIGSPNQPVDIPGGGAQSFFFAFTPFADIASTNVLLRFDCENSDPASSTVGLNTLLLIADSNPVPDIVALAETVSRDGIANVEEGSGVFAVATSNVGIGSDITVSVNTGGAFLPINVAVCETDASQDGICINPPAPTFDPVTTTVGANETPTFSFFINSTETIPFDPANNRIFVRFVDSDGFTRGSTSVAVRTQ